MSILLSKKFIFALVAIIAGLVLVLMDKTTADVWFRFCEIVGATYVAGNAVDKIADTKLEIADIK